MPRTSSFKESFGYEIQKLKEYHVEPMTSFDQ